MMLIILVFAMAASVGIYAVLVYALHIARPAGADLPAALPKVLGALAAICFLAGIALESMLLNKAAGPGQVQIAAIASSAMGEAIAILGLVLYFLTGDPGKFTPFLIGSAAYFAALFLRLPRFFSRLDEE
ncbi:MAG: hypothetical protein IT210_00875 [Armatimonadetes bacterium]|nr:hypothetical protein [Armatimonadota bacterium]